MKCLLFAKLIADDANDKDKDGNTVVAATATLGDESSLDEYADTEAANVPSEEESEPLPGASTEEHVLSNDGNSDGTTGNESSQDADAESELGAEKIARIEAARVLAVEVEAIASQIDEAAAAEDFDRAASLDDSMAREDGKLQALLASLSMTLEDLSAWH